MSRRLVVYLVVVDVLALVLLGFNLPHDLTSVWGHYLGWTVISLLSELLWLKTLSGEATASMASTANLATLMLWGRGPGMWIAALSTLLANIFFQRKPWVRATFNAAQAVLTMWATAWLWRWLGGPEHGLVAAKQLTFGFMGVLALVAVLLPLFICYMTMNRALVNVAVAWSSERHYLQVWKQDWLYTDRVLSDLALFFLCPLIVLSYGAAGYAGTALFFLPLYMIFESQRRYLELRNAQDMMIHRERMAAMGEMAAEIGHELRNQLVAISGRSQMLLKDAERETYVNVNRHASIIMEQARRMETLSRGLMDSFRPELKFEKLDVNVLIQRSVEFVRTQNKFDAVDWDMKLGGPLPNVRADPAQLQQVLLNLFINAADAMGESANGHKQISVLSEVDERNKRVRVVIADSGPGIPAKNLLKVFEPSFTTKKDGHGFGLSTSYRIVANHGGTIAADNVQGSGARFTIVLPIEGPSS